jgi:hypothetical protein
MNDNITKQLRMPKSHPVLCELTIDAMKWYRFQQLNEHTQETNFAVTVHTSLLVDGHRRAIVRGWAAGARRQIARLSLRYHRS